ncbi:unnamed protein product [Prunus armeniaca]|uniref:Uncharacterized protein n=1 Tax=Prunus armeniaca TaxID=36596 RepID=A0A6J5Y2S5_PRUAR|nr:unnamed protein product [Prunus armeniaca]
MMKFAPRFSTPHQPPLSPILPGSNLGPFPMEIPPREVYSQAPPALLENSSTLQFAGAPFGFVISLGSMAISWDCVSPDLSNPFALMPIIQLSEGLLRKSRSIPKKARRRVHGVYLGKPSVKRKQLEEVVICGELLVADADCVSPKRFCSGASSDKAKETALVESPRGPS